MSAPFHMRGSPYPVPPERLGGDLKRVWSPHQGGIAFMLEGRTDLVLEESPNLSQKPFAFIDHSELG